MGNNNHSHSRKGKLFHNIEHLADHFGVKRRGRLVKKHNLGIHCKSADYRNSLLLTARKLRRISLCFIGKPYSFQQSHRLFLRLVLFHNSELYGSKRYVFKNGVVIEKIELLENHTHFFAVLIDVYMLCCYVNAVKLNFAACRLLEPVKAAQEC